MDCLKNIKELISVDLERLISIQEKQIVSMALSKAEHTQITLFAAAAGETVSEEAYPGDTLYHVLSGGIAAQYEGNALSADTGHAFAVPAGQCHSLAFRSDTKFIQITINK